MGIKVNYNKKKNSKLKIAGFAILGLFIALILVKSFNNMKDSLPSPNNSNNNSIVYKQIEDIETIEDLIKSYSCKFISSENIDNVEKIYLTFDVGLYSGNNSNETHFLNICKGVAEFLKYKNFELIDKSKNIDIEIKCEEANIIEFKINGELNYYLTHDSEKNRNLSQSVTNFTIQSPELKQLIDGNWDESKVNWGTKDSNCNGYNIYFDEGINYKNVSRNVFNVIFTEKYKGQVAGNLSVNSTPEQVKSNLGEPTFMRGELYGYLGENNYLFFNFANKEISVYPVVKVTEDEEKKLKELIEDMNRTSDIKTFASDLTGLWLDYDIYDFSSDYVDLRYTLRGINLSISNNSIKNGIFIYQNYSGDRNISELENVYIQDTDFVFNYEKDRSDVESLSRIEQGDFTEEFYKEQLGVEFSVRFDVIKTTDSEYYKGAKFYSRNKDYPDSELDKNLEISSYIWYDDYKIIYSVDYDGLYVYNCRTKMNAKIVDAEDKIIINSAKEGEIIYNDNQVINVVID